MQLKKHQKIGILGSACNPPHTDHAAIGKYATQALHLDRLIIMPTGNPPHKNMPEVPAQMRLAMARVLAKKHGWEVSDFEIKRHGKSYTANTIAALRKKYPRTELYWIIGSDELLSMPRTWKFGYDILGYCQFVVAKRRGYPLRRVPAAILKKIIVLKRPARSVSSTMIRKAINRADFKTAKQFLDSKVLNFIIRNHLYLYDKS